MPPHHLVVHQEGENGSARAVASAAMPDRSGTVVRGLRGRPPWPTISGLDTNRAASGRE
jgi:hypothetical protein